MTAPSQTWPSGRQLRVLLVGYPVWWLIGIAPVVTFVACASVGVDLVRSRRIRWPAGFSLWLLFLAWVALGVLVTQVDAPLAVAALNVNRYLTWFLRLLIYLEATVVLLLASSLRSREDLDRVLESFGWMFVWIVAGGTLGVLAPGLALHSLVELALPGKLAQNAYVLSLVHPSLVERVLATNQARPSAPFPYANVWGLNAACFLPFFVYSWGRSRARWKRWATVPVLVVALVPVVFSLDRGLWVALLISGVVVVVRLVGTSGRAVTRLLAVVVVGVAVFAASPLHRVVSARLTAVTTSNQGRSELARRGFTSTLSSPIVGYGTTRNVQGSLTSIAGGATDLCPRCTPPSFGTQGQLFLVTFAQGYLGAVLYFGFVLVAVGCCLRIRGPDTTVALVVLVVHLATSFVYSADNLAILPVFLAAGLGSRAWLLRPTRASDRPAGMAPVVARRAPQLLIGTALGALAGAMWFTLTPASTTMTESVVIPDPASSGQSNGVASIPTSLDTLAQLLTDRRVIDAAARAARTSPAQTEQALSATAVPNSRVVNVAFTSQTRARAAAGARAAARALMVDRHQQLDRERAVASAAATAQQQALEQSLLWVRAAHVALAHGPNGPLSHAEQSQLDALRVALLRQWRPEDDAALALRTTPTPAGSVASGPRAAVDPTPWGRPVANGCAIGLLIGAGVPRRRRRRRRARAPGPSERPRWSPPRTSAPPNRLERSLDGPDEQSRSEDVEQFENGRGRVWADGSTVSHLAWTAEGHDTAEPARSAGYDAEAGARRERMASPTGSVLAVLRRRWLSAAVAFLVVTVSVGAFLESRGTTYTSTVSVFVQPVVGNALASDSSPSSQALTVAMETEANLVTSPIVMGIAAKTMPVTASAITATVPMNTQIVKIAYAASRPAVAQEGAAAVAAAFLAYRQEQGNATKGQQMSTLRAARQQAQTQLHKAAQSASSRGASPAATVGVQVYTSRLTGLAQAIGQVSGVSTNPGFVVQRPTPATSSFLHSVFFLAGVAVVAGLAAGVAAAFVRERLDDRVGQTAVGGAGAIPVLARVPGDAWSLGGDLVDEVAVEHPGREAYRELRAEVIGSADRPAVLAVTAFGAAPPVWVAANLALVLRDSGFEVCLVDARLDAGTDERASLPSGSGLAELLTMDTRTSSTPARLAKPRLKRWHGVSVLPSGRDLGSVRDRLVSDRLPEVIRQVREGFDYVVLVTPAVDSVESVAVAAAADTTLLIGEARQLRRRDVSSRVERYSARGIRVLGLVLLTRAPWRRRSQRADADATAASA